VEVIEEGNEEIHDTENDSVVCFSLRCLHYCIVIEYNVNSLLSGI